MNTNDGTAGHGRLILIRHAETDHNVQRLICGWTDSCLSERGHRQVERLGGHVAAAYAIERLYASPLQRAWLTAQAIARLTGLAPEAVDDLREIHFGELEGLSTAEFEARYPALYATWRTTWDLSHRWPGGESRHEFRQRVVGAFERIEVESQSRCVAVVTHGGVIGSYLATRIAGDPARWSDFAVRNCSVTEVSWRDGQPVIVCQDTVAHLADLI